MERQNSQAAERPASAGPALRVENLEAARPGGSFCLRGISFQAAAGELTGILGPNGGGKSTLLAALAGLLPLRRGSVCWRGREISGLGARRRAAILSLLPQKSEIPPGLGGGELVLMGRYARTVPWRGYAGADRRAAARALARTGCAAFADRPADSLSGGETQRLLLARSLAQEAPLLLLDEPGGGLDPGQGPAVFALLRDEADGAAPEKRCVIAAMHDLNLAALYCDRLIFLKGGEIFRQGPTAEVFTAATLAAVYGTGFVMAEHPSGRPQALCQFV